MEIKKININQIVNWEQNPRSIKTADFERLKNQIAKLGVYKPLMAYFDDSKGVYVVLGGNMRLRAYKELKIENVDVLVVNPKSEAEKLELALSDNDRVGYYDEQKLMELVYDSKDQITLENYSIDLECPENLKKLADDFFNENNLTDISEPVDTPPEKEFGIIECPECGAKFKNGK